MSARPGEVRVHVADAVVARVAARAARRVPGVLALRADLAQALLGAAGAAVRGGSSDLPADGVTAAVRGTTAEVRVTVVTRLGHNCRDLAHAVQRAVATEVRDYTGVQATVAVTVGAVLVD